MRKLILLASFLVTATLVNSQTKAYDRIDMFEKEDPMEITLKTDLKDILGKKANDRMLYSNIAMKIADSTVQGAVNIRARGKFRRNYCFVPPLKFDFDTSASPTLNPLGSIDMTVQCKQGKEFEQWLFKEYTATSRAPAKSK